MHELDVLRKACEWSDCVRILTAPGGLPGFWMVARDAQANLLPHFESPVWLSRQRHEEGRGGRKKSRQWAAIRRVSRRITEVMTEGNMKNDATLRQQRRNNDLWETFGMQRFENDNKGTKEVSHKVNADNETIYIHSQNVSN